MYFSQVRIDPNNPDVVYLGGVGLQMSTDGGKTFETRCRARSSIDDVHAIWINPKNSESRPDRQRRRPRRVVRHEQDVDVHPEPAGRPVLPRRLRHGDAVQRVRRHAGQLQLVRARARRGISRGIINYDWFQIQGGDGFVAIPDLRDSRIVYTESQDGNMTRKNTVTGEVEEHPARPTQTSRTRHAGEQFRFNWDTPMMLLAARPGHAARRGEPRVPVDRPRRFVERDQPRPHDERRSRRDRDDGPARQPDPHRAQRRHLAVADDRLARRVAEAAGSVLHGHRRRHRERVAGWRQDVAEHHEQPARDSRPAAWVSEVVPSKFDAGTVYVTVDDSPPERLRARTSG